MRGIRTSRTPHQSSMGERTYGPIVARHYCRTNMGRHHRAYWRAHRAGARWRESCRSKPYRFILVVCASTSQSPGHSTTALTWISGGRSHSSRYTIQFSVMLCCSTCISWTLRTGSSNTTHCCLIPLYVGVGYAVDYTIRFRVVWQNPAQSVNKPLTNLWQPSPT